MEDEGGVSQYHGFTNTGAHAVLYTMCSNKIFWKCNKDFNNVS